MNRLKRPAKAEPTYSSVGVRVRATVALVVSLAILAPVLFVFGGGRTLLMPGPLSSGHAAMRECQTCHTASGSTQFSWLSGIQARDPHADTLACLNCHKIEGQIAFYPHTATPDMLNGDLERLRTVAAQTPRPTRASVRDIAFPMTGVMNSELNCATCHADHKGTEFDITSISDAQCQSCHAVQFDSFDGAHPDFSNYPFKRRQRIKFDHTAHFTKHYPEVASKNDPGRQIPDTCAECHTSGRGRGHIDVVGFDQDCASCHIDQITGAERAIGPKGIAFLSLPGIDVQTLNEKGAAIGEWPELSEAELSPFITLIIGQKPEGQAMLRTIQNLDLLDLTAATDDEISAVTQLVWSIKGLLYALLSGKASDVLSDLNTSQGTQVNPLLIADLSANLPRDVIINAQLDWLPNLATEMLERRASLDLGGSGWSSAINEYKLSASVTPVELDRPEPAPGALAYPPVTAEATNPVRFAQTSDGGDSWTIDVYGRLIKGGSAPPPPPGDAAGEPVQDNPVQDNPLQDNTGEVQSVDDAPDLAAPDAPPDIGGDPINDPGSDIVDAGSDLGGGLDNDPAADLGAAPVFAPIESSVDTESWAEYGGWYRRDFTIYYRPAGHKDKFIYSWLNLTGPSLGSDNTQASSAIFKQLTLKDAQGQCIKCHSIDSRGNSGLKVNWAPSSIADKSMRFTKFVHEPHFAVMENDGCLTCHQLDRQGEFAKTYEQGNPFQPSTSFTPVKKNLCVECHGASGGAREDCLLCHQYHVQDVITPIIRTQLPRQ